MNIFERNVPGTREILITKKIAIAGCGGIGSNAAVSLTRAGIGHLILADFDRVEFSNLNRQQYFLDDIGQPKTEALAHHLRRINPELKITLIRERLTPDNLIPLMGEADLLIEAFDLAENKQWLISIWAAHFPDKPVIGGNGLAGYGNFESLCIVRSGNIYLCGDGQSDMRMGLCAARVAIVSNMQANLAIELLCKPQTDGR